MSSYEAKLEKRPSRGNLRLSRKQKTERVRRERINSSLDELKSLVCKEEEKQDKMDKADILEATVSFVRTARVNEYNQNPNFRTGYNQCVSEFVQFLISLDNVKPEDKAKLLSGMSSVLCGVEKDGENSSRTPSQPQRHDPLAFQHNGKVPIARLRQPLQTINHNMMTSSQQVPTSLSTASVSTSVAAGSKRGSLSSASSNSSLSSVASLLCDSIMPAAQKDRSFENIMDSVFSECDSGLETSLAKAVSAGISLELTDLSSIESETEIEEMTSLPSMLTFLEDLSK